MKKELNENSNKEKLISFRVTNEEYEILKEIAEIQCRNVSNCIRYTLRDIINDYKNNKNKNI